MAGLRSEIPDRTLLGVSVCLLLGDDPAGSPFGTAGPVARIWVEPQRTSFPGEPGIVVARLW